MSVPLVYITISALLGGSSTQDSATFRHRAPKVPPVMLAASAGFAFSWLRASGSGQVLPV